MYKVTPMWYAGNEVEIPPIGCSAFGVYIRFEYYISRIGPQFNSGANSRGPIKYGCSTLVRTFRLVGRAAPA